jgi:hypothetical protein
MWAGFSNGAPPGGISDQDWAAATNTASTADAALYPITPFATAMIEDVWPIVSNLLASGTGNRATVSASAWVRYNSMLFASYLYLGGILTINRLAYHFDWTKVFPFTENVPSNIYALAQTFDATDVGIAERWLPYIKRFETKIAFPRMVEEFKRMHTPMYSVDFNGRLLVPMTFDINDGQDAASVELLVRGWLDYIEGPLAATGATLTSFLPFPMSASMPWDLPITPVIDLDRETAWWNTGVSRIDPFGDTGDPLSNQCPMFVLTVSTGVSNEVIWHSRHTQPTWAEIKRAGVYLVNDNTLDNTFMLLGMHQMDNIIIPDDSGDSFRYDGTAVTSASVGYPYVDFANTRYFDNEVFWGVMRPGMLGAEFARGPYLRMMRLETGYQFSLSTLKMITQTMTGASLREIRATIYGAVISSENSGY